MTSNLSPGLVDWLDASANGLDAGSLEPSGIVPNLAASGLFRAGLAAEWGGDGGDITDAVEAIAGVSERSLAAGFVFWGQRTFIDYLVQSSNETLRQALLPDLLAGAVAGATGLSNAMKFLSGLEGLQIKARRLGDGYALDGKLPWVTNLRPQGFHVAAAVAEEATGATLVVSIPSDAAGVTRGADLELMAMRASNTAAIDLKGVPVTAAQILTTDARAWLPRVRPAFLGMQCGLSIGLARRGLAEARAHLGAGRHILTEPLDDLAASLARCESALREGLRGGVFTTAAAPLFELRIQLAEIAQEAVSLELQAAGGRAYLTASGQGFQRRWREAAFVPIITPSLVQLKAALATHRAELAGRAA
ncbi:MAG: acyl-CoA/acyl-ACP dehydrogenase [Beijerinckiaceae bacterium]|nr:acyl-CoA/acyl-ACP dehydrogenase [Beijerinckiaceae bacterium]